MAAQSGNSVVDEHMAIVITTKRVVEVEGWPEKAIVSPAALLGPDMQTYVSFTASNGSALYEFEGFDTQGNFLLRKRSA